MVKISTDKIKTAVYNCFREICVSLDTDVCDRLKKCKAANPLEDFALTVIRENAAIAIAQNAPVCQDTGLAVVFVDIGQNVCLTDSYLEDAINLGVKEAYSTFRKSTVTPIDRINLGDNTPAIIHTRIVPGDTVTLSCMAKGFGSENMSRVFMLTPADGVGGIIDSIVKTVKEAGGCPCPPVILGVGIGGDMEKAAVMSKHALLRGIDTINPDQSLDVLENEILDRVNGLKIGAEGFGGDVTALKVLIEIAPTHIAGLPLAVTVQCHCSRHKTAVIGGEND